MTRRSIGNRQKKVVRPRPVRGGERPVRPTPPRPAPTLERPKEGGLRREDGPPRERE